MNKNWLIICLLSIFLMSCGLIPNIENFETFAEKEETATEHIPDVYVSMTATHVNTIPVQPEGTNTVEPTVSATEKIATPTIQEQAAPEQMRLFVAHYKVECFGSSPQECFMVRENTEEDWGYFYDTINGFEWEAGFEYEILVKVIKKKDPPADASDRRYELVEIISRTPFVAQSMDYITISEPEDGGEASTCNGLLVEGMGAGLFEGNVALHVLDMEGNVLHASATIVETDEMGGEGPWSIRLKYAVRWEVDVVIFAFSTSPKDGSLMASDRIEVHLKPCPERVYSPTNSRDSDKSDHSDIFSSNKF